MLYKQININDIQEHRIADFMFQQFILHGDGYKKARSVNEFSIVL